jgi:hypothetical protein
MIAHGESAKDFLRFPLVPFTPSPKLNVREQDG